MHEQAKIDEARYFLAQMVSVISDRNAFKFNLSAFLTSARSALQYALKEAEKKSGGRAWYDTQVLAWPVVGFLRDKRNISIHAAPINPHSTITASVTDVIHVSESLPVSIQGTGKATEEVQSPGTSHLPPLEPETESAVTYQYFFPDWSGPESVLDLCRAYIAGVESIVSDGVSKGLLTS